jgi:transcriptional regulator with XRE-family HTH domain
MNTNIFLKRIELLCLQKGVTKTKAFIDSGVGKDFTGNIQRGSTPSLDKVTALAAYFNVSVDYLLGNDTSATKAPATDEELKFALFNGTDGITDEMFEEVKQYAAMVKLREQQKGKK